MKIVIGKASWLLLCFCIVAAVHAQQPLKVEVRISGIEGELRQNARAFLGIVEAGEEEETGLLTRINPFAEEPAEKPEITDEDVRRLHRRAPGEIRQALQPYGYYDPRIQSSLEQTDSGWIARYEVDPGPPTRLEKVEIDVRGEGRDEPAIKEVLSGIKISEGQTLNHNQYESAKRALFDAAYKGGYLDARYARSEIRVNPEQRRAEIALLLETGPRFYFGPIEIDQDILRPSFVQRFVDIEPGSPFDTDKLLDLQFKLNDSDYFSRVEMQVHRDQAEDHRVPVTVRTEPLKSQRYTVGAGLGTDTGPRVRLGGELRRINRRGHQFRTDLLVSAVKRSLSAQYLIPFKNIATDRYAFTATAQQEELGDADTDQFIIGASRNEGWLGFRRRLYLEFHRENFDFDPGPRQQSDLLFPGINLTRQVADDELFARRGYSVTVDVHGGAEALLSETSFGRADLDSRAVWPWSDRGRLLLHGHTGAVWTDSFSDLPPSQRFFAGGDRSVRGYSFQSIGPQDAAGNTIGGEYLVLGSVEADYLFYRDYGAALFFDAGDAFSESPDLQKSAGIGLRWRSPVGMVRLDFAHPFDDPDSDFRFHLSIGPDL